MPFCYTPWTNIDINPMGNISPCCKFRHEYYSDPRLNIITSDLAEYKNSNLLQSVKDDFLNNTWPAGCERCKIEEQNGIESKRQLDYTRWEHSYKNYDRDSGKFLTASVAFGNTCNLKCITCSPSSSSKWHKEYKKIYKIDTKPNHFYKENFINELIEQCPDLIHLDIPGGEPFLSGVTQQHQLLDYYIKSGKSKDIAIHYTTNVTVFPDNSWWNRWNHFKEIDIQLSIDGIKNRYEYIRFPAQWNDCDNNVNRYLEKQHQEKNIKLSVSHTLGAFNVLYLDEFFSWCEQKGLPRPWIGRVHNPAHFRCSVFPDSIKEQIVNQLRESKYEDVILWSEFLQNNNDSDQFAEFLNKKQTHDEYRNTNFELIFPELAELIANYQKQV